MVSLFAKEPDFNPKQQVKELFDSVVDRLKDANDDMENVIICQELHSGDDEEVLSCMLKRLSGEDSSSILR